MLKPDLLSSLHSRLSSGKVFTDPVELIPYETDAGLDRGIPDGLVFPENTHDVQRFMCWASENNIAVVARGSGTGFTGGAVAPTGGIILSFTRMNRSLTMDEDSLQVVVQPGVVNKNLNQQLQPLELYYPPDPASHAVSTIGGNIAENAGGPHCLKYGVTRDYLMGLEIVLANGQKVRLGGSVFDPPEYDFISLVTGSEGTLALVTEARLRLRPVSLSVQTLTASFESIVTAGEAVASIIAAGLIPATIELMDGSMVAIVEEYLQAGFPQGIGAMLIMDVDGYPDSLRPQLDQIAVILERFEPIEVKIAQDEQSRELLWLGRRSAAGAIARISPNELLLDVCVPLSRLAETLDKMTSIAKQNGFRVTFLAHAGDGNLHPTLMCDFSIAGELERAREVASQYLELCSSLGGTISGEHGVGIEKRKYLPAMYGSAEINAMLEIKHIFDPQGILNPGKVFPPEFDAHTVKSPARLEKPEEIFTPHTALEAAEGLGALQDQSRAVYISGGRTQWRGEPPPSGCNLVTSDLSGIVAISTRDMFATVRASTPIQELQASLAEKGFWLPVAGCCPGSTTGGLLAANTCSPLRRHYGSPRDLTLAVEVALADGRLLRFGRPLVKDVAGYNMARLFGGAFGSLGLLSEITWKILPRPQSQGTLLVDAPDLLQGIAWGLAALRCSRINAGIVLLANGQNDQGSFAWQLIITAEGHALDVKTELEDMHSLLRDCGAEQVIETDQTSAVMLWEKYACNEGFLARAGAPPQFLPLMISRLESHFLDACAALDISSGTFFYTHGSLSYQEAESLLAALRQASAGLGGYAVMAAGPRNWLTQIDAWGAPRPSYRLMRSLKLRWDPSDILNRSEFAAPQNFHLPNS